MKSSKEPFFIVGAQRSGTTMLRLMLNSHPRIGIPFESGFIPEFFRRSDSYGPLENTDNLTRIVDDIAENTFVKKGGLLPDKGLLVASGVRDLPQLIDRMFSDYARRNGKVRWGDKTPSYVEDIDVLKKLFPDCRIIHLVRDGRDVALSLRTLDWGTKNIPRIAEDWRWKTILARKIGNILNGDYLEVRYEDLILDTERELKRICSFLGESFDDSMLSYFKTAGNEMPEQSMKYHATSVKTPDSGKVYGWKRKMSIADRIIFEQVAGDALSLFGYEVENRKGTLGSKLKNFYYSSIVRW